MPSSNGLLFPGFRFTEAFEAVVHASETAPGSSADDLRSRLLQCTAIVDSSTTDHNGEPAKSTRHLSFSFEPDVTLIAKGVLMLVKIVQKIILGLSVF